MAQFFTLKVWFLANSAVYSQKCTICTILVVMRGSHNRFFERSSFKSSDLLDNQSYVKRRLILLEVQSYTGNGHILYCKRFGHMMFEVGPGRFLLVFGSIRLSRTIV